MHDDELNRVLGGGLVPASLVLIGGESGIGKSTLELQTILKLQDIKTLYVSVEESARQLKLTQSKLVLMVSRAQHKRFCAIHIKFPQA